MPNIPSRTYVPAGLQERAAWYENFTLGTKYFVPGGQSSAPGCPEMIPGTKYFIP